MNELHVSARHPMLVIGVLMTVASAAHADSASSTMAIYAPDGSATPHFRIWNGSAWGSAANLPAMSGYPYWLVARNCPTRNETVCTSLDHQQNLQLTAFDGSSWSTPIRLCDKVGKPLGFRPFDAAYEGGGDLLIAYYDKQDSNDNDYDDGDDDSAEDDEGGSNKGWRYRTYESGDLSSEHIVPLPSKRVGRWLKLTPRPRSNQILLVASDRNKDLMGAVWTGSSFTSAAVLETDLAEKGRQCWTTAFEAVSQQGLIIYAEKQEAELRFRTVDGTTISAEMIGPSLGHQKLKWLKAASRPGTDEIMLVALNHTEDLHAVYWNGTAWGTETEIGSTLQYSDRMNFDVAFQPDGAKCLLIHSARRVGTIKHRIWSAGAWGSTLDGSDGGSTNAVLALFPTAGSQIFGMISATDDDLMAVRWNGSALSTHVDLSGAVAGAGKSQAFTVVSAAVDEDVEDDGPAAKKVVQWQETDPR